MKRVMELMLCLLGFHDWERMLSRVSGHDLYVCRRCPKIRGG